MATRQPKTTTAGNAKGAGSPARRDRAPALSAELIVDRALELTDREGAPALTMRRLGQELGVDPTAVYRHFRDKDELVLACMDRLVEEAHAAIESGVDRSDWRAVLRATSAHSWRACKDHPAIYAMACHRTTGGPGERKMVELLLSSLASTGLSPERTVLYYRAFVDSMLGMCGMKAASESLAAPLREKDNSAWTRIYAILPQAEYPVARAHAQQLAEVTEWDIYRSVTDSVISLIEDALRG
jgi:AcrR family transcriptional regulator